MIAIIVGEVFGTGKSNNGHHFPNLKEQLGAIVTPPDHWEIREKELFCLEIQNPEEALIKVLQLKSAIKKQKNLEVRMAIGIGEDKDSILELSPGQQGAMDYAETLFGNLKKQKINLEIRSDFIEWDETMNLMFRFALLIMDKWSVSSAELVNMLCWERDLLQEQIAERLRIKQAAVSQRYSRAEVGLIFDLEKYFRQKIASILVS